MYKSKLQELCQQKSWSLPEYTTTKHGLDHSPRFEATVTINGLSFNNTLNQSKSLKEAQNDVAKRAFLHFSSSSSSSSSSPLSRSSSSSSSISASNGSSTANDLSSNLPRRGTSQIIQETNQTPHFNGTASVVKEDRARGSSSANDLNSNLPSKGTLQRIQETNQTPHINGTASVVKEDRARDIQQLYKNQLQTYAQKRNLSLPLYTCEREGPPHASRFKCKVTVDGQTFENPEFFPTLKEAEHGVAKIALLSLSPDGVQEDDSGIYKNLLQELAQKEGYPLPTYNTERSGEAHTPAFVTNVEVGGKVFTGWEAKTKKQAEMTAAKVAYTKLKERKSSQSPTFPSLSCQGQEGREFSFSGLHPDISDFPQPSLGPIEPVISASISIPMEQAEEDRGNVHVSSHPPPVTFSEGNEGSFSSDPFVLDGPSSSSSPFDCFSTLVAESKIEPPASMSPSYRNRVIVRPRVPNMTFPVNSTVLPMSDDNWVAVKLNPQSNQE